MTKEEILDKSYKNGMHWKAVNRKNVLAAMEEYAQQQLAPNFLSVLEENYQAHIAAHYNGYDHADEEIKIRSAITKEYEDLIAIYKQRAAQTDVATLDLLETVKISLTYRDFGVLNEHLTLIGEKKIEMGDNIFQPKPDVATDDDWMKELNDFLDYNLEESKKATGQHEYFMAGWIAALMHVKVNFKPLKQ